MKITTIIAITSLGLAALSAEAREGRPMERLKAADANGDGMISRAEAAGLPRIAKRFDEIDANRDGQLTFEEIRGFHAHARADHFKRLDADGDGMISRAEAQAGAPRLAQHFDRIDANKDGLLSKDELAAMHGRRGQK